MAQSHAATWAREGTGSRRHEALRRLPQGEAAKRLPCGSIPTGRASMRVQVLRQNQAGHEARGAKGAMARGTCCTPGGAMNERLCTACHKWRALTQFPRDVSNVIGYACAACAKAARAAARIKCACCHSKREPSRFPRLADGSMAPVCIPCQRIERKRAKRRPMGPTARHRALYRSYGLKPHF